MVGMLLYDPGMDFTLIVSILAAVFSGLGLLLMLRQLQTARDAVGGRVMGVEAQKIGVVRSTNGGPLTADVRIKVEQIGPVILHNVDVEVRGLGRTPADEPATRAVLTCESNPIVWEFEAEVSALRNTWCVVSWVERTGHGLRTHAVTKNISGDGLYVWKWKPLFRFRLWWQYKRDSTPKPLGRWVRYKETPLKIEHGPRGHLPKLTKDKGGRPSWPLVRLRS
jgi:hypothetical protein